MVRRWQIIFFVDTEFLGSLGVLVVRTDGRFVFARVLIIPVIIIIDGATGLGPARTDIAKKAGHERVGNYEIHTDTLLCRNGQVNLRKGMIAWRARDTAAVRGAVFRSARSSAD
jgi:hypothetical protein